MTSNWDMGGNDLIVNTVSVGATAPGQAGTSLSGAELTVLDGITPGTAAASKALVLNSSSGITTGLTALTVTTVTPTTIAGAANFSGTPTFASGATVTGTVTATGLSSATLNTTGLQTHGAASTTKSNASSVTCSSNAATTTTQYTKITSESLTTAHTASQALVITYTGTATTDFAVATIIGGTNTQGVPVLKTACTTDTVTITIQNNAIATNAFNGTFIIWLQVFKA